MLLRIVRKLQHHRNRAFQELAHKLANYCRLALAVFSGTARTMDNMFPSRIRLVLHILGHWKVQKRHQLATGIWEEFHKFLLQGLHERGDQLQCLPHFVQHRCLQAQKLAVTQDLGKLVVVFGNWPGWHLFRLLLQDLQEAREQRRHVGLEILAQHAGHPPSGLMHVLPGLVICFEASSDVVHHDLHDAMRIVHEGVLADSFSEKAGTLEGFAAETLLMILGGVCNQLLQRRHNFLVVGQEKIRRSFSHHRNG
mmetsp:Transcript_109169/g.260478  ORF Transcript_109169/g.260478 Transcript_109169/m.260478 type:complete len:253 (-) Transcript_109169:70-828(-)